MQAYQRKTEKFFVSEEKKFGRIDSRLSVTLSQQNLNDSILFISSHFLCSILEISERKLTTIEALKKE